MQQVPYRKTECGEGKRMRKFAWAPIAAAWLVRLPEPASQGMAMRRLTPA